MASPIGSVVATETAVVHARLPGLHADGRHFRSRGGGHRFGQQASSNCARPIGVAPAARSRACHRHFFRHVSSRCARPIGLGPAAPIRACLRRRRRCRFCCRRCRRFRYLSGNSCARPIGFDPAARIRAFLRLRRRHLCRSRLRTHVVIAATTAAAHGKRERQDRHSGHSLGYQVLHYEALHLLWEAPTRGPGCEVHIDRPLVKRPLFRGPIMTPPPEGASTEADSTTARTIVNTAIPVPTSLTRQPERCESPPRTPLIFRACRMRSRTLPVSHSCRAHKPVLCRSPVHVRREHSHSRSVRAAQQVSVCR